MKVTNLIIIALIVLTLISACSKTSEKPQLSELQVTACNTADDANTCDTKLAELDLVTKEQCCQSLGKCCSRN